MTSVLWTVVAVDDLAEIHEYVRVFNPPAAHRLRERLIVAGEALQEFPERGRPVPGTELRELTVVYPYIIRYRVEGERVLILRVRHGRQRP